MFDDIRIQFQKEEYIEYSKYLNHYFYIFSTEQFSNDQFKKYFIELQNFINERKRNKKQIRKYEKDLLLLITEILHNKIQIIPFRIMNKLNDMYIYEIMNLT